MKKLKEIGIIQNTRQFVRYFNNYTELCKLKLFYKFLLKDFSKKNIFIFQNIYIQSIIYLNQI